MNLSPWRACAAGRTLARIPNLPASTARREASPPMHMPPRELLKAAGTRPCEVDLDKIDPEPTEQDYQAFCAITTRSLTPEQARRIQSPADRFPRQEYVLAVHWHPEQVPLDMAHNRVKTMCPGARDELVIPTQHNQLLTLGDYAGVEVDCYSHGFSRKVQLLVHLRAQTADRAATFANMLEHTFKYRATQLYDYLDALTDAKWRGDRDKAARVAGSDEDVVEFCTLYSGKLKKMLLASEPSVHPDAYKNKLMRDYFDTLRQFYGQRFIAKVQLFLKTVKEQVKERFSLAYFYRTSEIIEEVRGLGGGIVIPHPEQFWPILLADYDVDGIEVWNPQSQQYTEFLISVVVRRNRQGRAHGRDVLIFMGDDCHLSEKLKKPEEQNPEKVQREVGLQPAWDDLLIRKGLITAGVSRKTVMDEYRARLG